MDYVLKLQRVEKNTVIELCSVGTKQVNALFLFIIFLLKTVFHLFC